MVKVAHFISTSGVYGAERWILALLNHLKGIDSLLICPTTSNRSILKEAERIGVRTISLKVKGNYNILDFIKKLSRTLEEESIDILHTHGYKADFIGFFAARKTKTKIISTPHGWSKNAGFKIKLYEALDRQILRLFDLVAPHTTAFKKSLKKIKKIRWINNFIDLGTIPKIKKGDLKLITYIGQLIERKRIQDIIISLKYLKDTKLQIIGDGPKRKSLINLTKRLGLNDRVKFLGYRNDRLNLLNRSGIFVLPSTLDWIPRVLMEAMAMGRSVIGTDIKGIRFLIKNKETGLLVPTKTPKKIAEAISYMQKNKKQAGVMAKKARFLIENRFSAEIAAKEYEKLYKGLK